MSGESRRNKKRSDGVADDALDLPPSTSERAVRTVRSALWAAYGDAIGFISELTNSEGLNRRTRGAPLEQPVRWSRRVGGRQGVSVALPAGCYSDDTQLRLSSGRATSSSGFDVEAFAKVELTVWPAYALGGGKGTKAAASNLAKAQTTWYGNTYPDWTSSGGNGAAMRIQPHVWASRSLSEPATYVIDVLRNAVCTHGSPTGLIGAVWHAVVLADVMSAGRLPEPGDLKSLVEVVDEVPNLIRRDPRGRHVLAICLGASDGLTFRQHLGRGSKGTSPSTRLGREGNKSWRGTRSFCRNFASLIQIAEEVDFLQPSPLSHSFGSRAMPAERW
jgi:hypothetical protein